ncbi:MAG: hypothetical protein IJ004_05400 [Clostridia bacterium]|nr:hypothetical protein [Clostridia bacterium]
MKKTFQESFYRNAPYVCVVLISLIYIGGSLLLISKTGRSVSEIIASGVLSMLVGFLINGILRDVGIRRGDEDEKMLATTKLHSQVVERATPLAKHLDRFCQIENENALARVRSSILIGQGMDYHLFFDDNGGVISHRYQLYSDEEIKNAGFFAGLELRARNRKRKKALDRAINTKIKHLTPSQLTTFGGKEQDPFDFGQSKSKYSRGQNALDVIMRLLMAVVFGYFGVTLASEINVASIIWNSLQIIMYLCSGVVQMYGSYMWVIDTYRCSIVRKIDLLEKFCIFAKEQEMQNFEGEKFNNIVDN